MDRLKQLLERRPGHLTPEECQWLFSEIESLRQEVERLTKLDELHQKTATPAEYVVALNNSYKQEVESLRQKVRVLYEQNITANDAVALDNIELASLRQQLAETDPYKPLWAVVEQLGLNEETGCPDSRILEHVSSLKEQLAEAQERIKLLIAADLPHVIQIDDLSQQLAASEAKNVLPITLEEINPLKERQVARKRVHQEKGEGQKWLKTYAVVEDIDLLFSFYERLSHHQHQDHKLLEDKERQLAEADPYKHLWAVVDQLELGGGGCPDSRILEHVSSLKEQLAAKDAEIEQLRKPRMFPLQSDSSPVGPRKIP